MFPTQVIYLTANCIRSCYSIKFETGSEPPQRAHSLVLPFDLMLFRPSSNHCLVRPADGVWETNTVETMLLELHSPCQTTRGSTFLVGVDESLGRFGRADVIVRG